MSNYIITKAHLDQLTPEQKEKLREWWTPEKEDKLLLEKSGRIYTVKGVRGSKIMVGSFGVEKEKCLPLLTESDLLHGLAEAEGRLTIKADLVGELPLDIIRWSVITKQIICREQGLIDALWKSFKTELLA